MPKIAVTPSEWQIIAEILRQHVPARDIWVFGSRANGKTKPYSDLDLAIGGNEPLTLSREAALRDAFDDSALPYKVDIVELAAIGAEFRGRIEKDLVLVLAGK